MSRTGSSTRTEAVTVFACTAALDRLPEVHAMEGIRLTRLLCAGRINAGMILRAVEQNSGRVLVLACNEASCRHQTGARLAEEQVGLARELMHTLGLDRGTVSLELVDRTGTSRSIAPAGTSGEPS